MSMTRFRAHPALFLAACTLLFVGIAFAQDNPDRPPWAQKPKTTSASASSKAPASSPTGEAGKIVQPPPPASTKDAQDAAAQRAQGNLLRAGSRRSLHPPGSAHGRPPRRVLV